MAKTILIIIDDIHLEGRPEEMQISFAKKLHDKISLVTARGDFPILVCAGDINEGVAGIDWVSQFKCDIVYVCGNHEFWNGDYFELIDAIKDKVAQDGFKHVHFLHNEVTVIAGVRFIGATLWTDLAKSWAWYGKNQVVSHYLSMADFKNVTAKKWFDRPVKKAQLMKFMENNGVDSEKIKDIISNKLFNPLLQIEEHATSVNFIEESLKESFQGKTVVVTHHLPTPDLWIKKFDMSVDLMDSSYINNNDVYEEYKVQKVPAERDVLRPGFYINTLYDLFGKEISPDIWVHGHFHKEINDYIGRTRVASSPVGYMMQSEEFCFKEIFINYEKQYLLRYLKAEVDLFNWNDGILNNVENFSNIIKNYYKAINADIIEVEDFIPIFNMFLDKHKENIVMIEKKISDWFYALLTLSDKKNHRFLNQYYITSNAVGFTNWSVIKKVSRLNEFNFVLTQNSFLPEKKFNKLLGEPEMSYSLEWINELERFSGNVNMLKIALKAFFDEMLVKNN